MFEKSGELKSERAGIGLVNQQKIQYQIGAQRRQVAIR